MCTNAIILGKCSGEYMFARKMTLLAKSYMRILKNVTENPKLQNVITAGIQYVIFGDCLEDK